MAAFTEHYNLIQPGPDDFYDVADWNENMDTIDTLLAENEAAAKRIDGKIGSHADEGSETVFGKLNQIQTAAAQGGSFIKSVQRIIYHVPKGTVSASLAINPIAPAKSFVIFERLKEEISEYLTEFIYTLNAESIDCTFKQNSSDTTRIYGFWIIEFM